MKPGYNLAEITAHFATGGAFVQASPCGSGHINDSYCVTVQQAQSTSRYLLQRMNHTIFKDTPALMENIQRVTAHLSARVEGQPDASRRVLSLIPTQTNAAWHTDATGDHWRMYRFVEGARSYDIVQSPEQAFQAAKAFGEFQRLLVDLPGPRLHDTIPDFHNTPKRFAALQQAIEADRVGLVSQARREIEFALARQSMVGVLLGADLPERVTHNDTKFNNVMLDDVTGEGICVIDLDTVMPGLAPYDFGDMVRTATSPTAEDERDLSKVGLQIPIFEALLRGYLASANSFLTRAEKDHLVFAGKLITFEIGIRFIADYLDGDTYYKVHRPNHNLDRCRTQFKLVESIEEQEATLNQLVHSIG